MGTWKQALLQKKERELGVNFPQGMVEFYKHFGNDAEVMASFYELSNIEDIYVEDNDLFVGKNHESDGKIKIYLDYLKFLCEDEDMKIGNIIPVFGKGILGCYIVDAEKLYLGTVEDEVMEEYEELLELDFDYL